MYVANKGGEKDQSSISQLLCKIGRIFNGCPHVVGVQQRNRTIAELTPELSGSYESKMATDKPEVLEIQLLY